MAKPTNRGSNQATSKAVVGGGVIAGLISGFFMILVAMIYTAIIDAGFWTPLNLIAATWYGPEAVQGGAWVGITGAITHLVVASIWGVVFASLTPRIQSAGKAFGWGLLYGIAVWAVMSFIFLPLVNPTMSQATANMSGWWFFFHLVYGGSLGLTPAAERSVEPAYAYRRQAPTPAR